MFPWVVCPVVCRQYQQRLIRCQRSRLQCPHTGLLYEIRISRVSMASHAGGKESRENEPEYVMGARKRAVHHRSIRYQKRAVDRDTGGRDNRPYKGFGTSQFADAVQAGLCHAGWLQFCPGTARSEAGLRICSLRSVDQGRATNPRDHQRTHARICLDRCAGFAGCSLRRALNASAQPVQRFGCWLALACLL